MVSCETPTSFGFNPLFCSIIISKYQKKSKSSKYSFKSPFTLLLISLLVNEFNELLKTGPDYNYMRVKLPSFLTLCFEFKKSLINSTPFIGWWEQTRWFLRFTSIAAKNTLWLSCWPDFFSPFKTIIL